MNKLGIGLAVIVFVAFSWFFELRPAFACMERGGSPIRGTFDNVVCVESR